MANASPAKTLTVPASMKAWVLGNPDELKLVDKPVPQPGAAEVLVRIDAIAVCATDLEIIHSGPPALIQGALRSTRISRPATNTWAPSSNSAPVWTSSTSAIA